MSQLAELLKAMGTLAWPVILAVVLWKFYQPLKNVIESARGRRFTVKVAGNELTVDEANEQQQRLLSDLQAKIAELQRQIETILEKPEPTLEGAREQGVAQPRSVRTVLWVDDEPKNNSYVVATLSDLGVMVKQARSTQEALQVFEPGRFDRIVTDMGRPEGDKAGIDLVRLVRSRDTHVPIVIYSSTWAATNLRREAMAAGATGITSSATTLLALLDLQAEGRDG